MWVMPNGWFQMHSECDAFDDTHSSTGISYVQCYHILVRTIVSKIFPKTVEAFEPLIDIQQMMTALLRPR